MSNTYYPALDAPNVSVETGACGMFSEDCPTEAIVIEGIEVSAAPAQ